MDRSDTATLISSNGNNSILNGLLVDNAFTTNRMISSFPAELLKKLRPYLHQIEVKADDFLYQQDDEIDYIYFPETAIFSELHLLDDGRMVEVALTGRESAIGLLSIFRSDHVPNCVQAIQGGTVLRIESCMLNKLGREIPNFIEMLYSAVEHYIRQISQKAVCNMYHSLEERFCTWLLMMSDRSDRRVLKLTHEQIARTLGVYRPSVTFVAMDLRERQLIDYSRGGIKILDPHQIQDIACGCYEELEGSYH